eukprot:GDKH01001011.1.p3 GENE.GDKH01001011.1~~GDKH01001011.1.p3  ORF type:complete len:50 (-),score=4.20 GDKH01001011.1:3-152(-)
MLIVQTDAAIGGSPADFSRIVGSVDSPYKFLFLLNLSLTFFPHFFLPSV